MAINDYEAVKTIQKASGGFDKSNWYDKTSPGLIGMRDRERHSRRRWLLAHPLSNSSLSHFEPLIQEKTDLAMAKIREEGRQLGCADVHKWFSLMATDIIGDLTFGSSFRMLEQGKVRARPDPLSVLVPTKRLVEKPIRVRFADHHADGPQKSRAVIIVLHNVICPIFVVQGERNAFRTHY